MLSYIIPYRRETVAARVTREDRRLLEAAAAARGATLSSYIAEVATQAARVELLQPQAGQRPDSPRPHRRLGDTRETPLPGELET